jgi:hypothetical protein
MNSKDFVDHQQFLQLDRNFLNLKRVGMIFERKLYQLFLEPSAIIW